MRPNSRMSRRALALVGVSALAMSVAACSSSSKSSSTPSSAATAGSSGAGPVSSSPPATASADQTKIIADAGKSSDNSWCGTKSITLGIQDGFGTNGWSKSSMAAVRSEAAKCSNVKQVAQIGLGSLPDSITQINGMVAQGVNALVVIPDFGKAELPAIRKATQAGVKVVPWAADPGGEPGKDYVAYVDYNTLGSGTTLADWMTKTLHGSGNVVFLGGPAGNPVSVNTLAGIKASFDKNSGMKLLTGYSDWPITNWDAAKTQQVMASLLAKYPQIDGVIDDADGFDAAGLLRAYTSAGKQIPPVATFENNSLGCGYPALQKSNPKYQLATISTRNWLGRIAARKAIAAATGGTDTAPNIYTLPLYDDTTTAKAPHCDKALPADSFLSAQLTVADLNLYGKAS